MDLFKHMMPIKNLQSINEGEKMSVYSDEIHIKTQRELDIVDITGEIQNIVRSSKLHDGIICVFVPGSTGTLTTIEYEPGLMKDLPRTLERIAPKKDYYYHHETWHDDNGHSHVRASLMGPSITVPFQNKKLLHKGTLGNFC